MPVNWRSRRVASCERLFIRRSRHSARRLPRDARLRVAAAGEAKQYGKRDIAKGYLQAVSKASQYIYIENQYFRWAPLAEKIKESAQGQTGNGRDPAIHGPLYLFAITNADNEELLRQTAEEVRKLCSNFPAPGLEHLC